jgi:thiamine kinase
MASVWNILAHLVLAIGRHMYFKGSSHNAVDAQKLIQLIPELRGRSLTATPLGGGLTNRNFRLDGDGESFVLRVPGKDTALLGIDRACEVACSRAAAALGVGPEVVAFLPEHGVILRRFVPGRMLTAEDMQQPEMLGHVVESLRRYHNGPPGEGKFSPFETVRQYHTLAGERNVSFPERLEHALKRLAGIEQDLHRDTRSCPCHNDLLPANFIESDGAIRIIDWEYAGMGDCFFDLGNLAVNCEFNEQHERMLLALYFGQTRSDDLRRLRLMRLASDMREAMWGFLQSALSTLNEDYLAYGRKHLERFLDRSGRMEMAG